MSAPTENRRGITNFLAKRWLTILLVVLAGIFIAQNRDRVSLDLFWASLQAPLWLALLVLFVVGLIAGMVTFRQRSKRSKTD